MYKKANFKGQIKCKTLKKNEYECKNKYLSFVFSECFQLKYLIH